MTDQIVLDGISKTFNGKIILNDICLRLTPNTITALVGKNGAGKTTLLKCIGGLLQFNGNIIFPTKMYSNRYCLDNTGTYIQDVPALYPYMTGYEYLKFCYSFLPKEQNKVNIDTLLREVSLEREEASIRIKNYSRGMKQKLLIAQHLMLDSKLLLFDEPTSSLDPIAKAEILQLISKLKTQCTIVISSHEVESIFDISDYISIIDRGRVVYNKSKCEYFKELKGLLRIDFYTIPRVETIINLFKEIATKDEISVNNNSVRLLKCINHDEIIEVQRRLIKERTYFINFTIERDIGRRLEEILIGDIL